MITRYKWILVFSMLFGIYMSACASNDINPLEGQWNVFSKNEMGKLVIKNDRYEFLPKKNLIIGKLTNPKKHFFFLEDLSGMIQCNKRDANTLNCIINDKENVTAKKEAADCEWTITHDDRKIPWFGISCIK